MAIDGIVTPLPGPRGTLPEATRVRSTLLLSSLQSLRTRGLFERYVAVLDAAHRDAMLEAVAGAWLPMAVGIAHTGRATRSSSPRRRRPRWAAT